MLLLDQVDKSSESVYAAPVTRKRTDLLQVPKGADDDHDDSADETG